MPQGWEWLIILLIALLLFGGTKLAGLGKASGRAIREFKEETKGLHDGKQLEDPAALGNAQNTVAAQNASPAQPVQQTTVEKTTVYQTEANAPVDAEIVRPQQPNA